MLPPGIVLYPAPSPLTRQRTPLALALLLSLVTCHSSPLQRFTFTQPTPTRCQRDPQAHQQAQVTWAQAQVPPPQNVLAKHAKKKPHAHPPRTHTHAPHSHLTPPAPGPGLPARCARACVRPEAASGLPPWPTQRQRESPPESLEPSTSTSNLSMCSMARTSISITSSKSSKQQMLRSAISKAQGAASSKAKGAAIYTAIDSKYNDSITIAEAEAEAKAKQWPKEKEHKRKVYKRPKTKWAKAGRGEGEGRQGQGGKRW